MSRYIYEQKTGRFIGPDNNVIHKGYSGHKEGKNNPALEHVRAVGPIPRGDWEIDMRPYNSKNVGPYALILNPVGHNALGRTAFRIHGDSIKAPGTASNGCIILPRGVRERIVRSGIKVLRVVAGE